MIRMDVQNYMAENWSSKGAKTTTIENRLWTCRLAGPFLLLRKDWIERFGLVEASAVKDVQVDTNRTFREGKVGGDDTSGTPRKRPSSMTRSQLIKKGAKIQRCIPSTLNEGRGS